MLDTSQLVALDVADNKVRVFVSYSHQDAQYMESGSLLGFLSGLKESGIELWTDQRLVAGEAWDEKIRMHLRESDIALVLVSQAFLDSSYCTNVEISGFLEKRSREGMVIFPIILSPCEWQRHDWLKSFQVLPGMDQTVEEDYVDPGRRKRLFLRIRKDLREQAYRIKARHARENRVQAVQRAREEPKPRRRPRRFGCLVAAVTVALLAAAVVLPVEDWLPLGETRAEGDLRMLRGWVRDGLDKGRAWLAGNVAPEQSFPAAAPLPTSEAAQEETSEAAEDGDLEPLEEEAAGTGEPDR